MTNRVLVALLLAATSVACVGAPHSLDELATMPQEQFDSWKARLGDAGEVGGYAVAAHGKAQQKQVHETASALRLLAGKTPTPAEIDKLKMDPATDALVRLALGELSAFVAQYGKSEGAMPRVREVTAAVAAGLDAGAARAEAGG